MNWMADAREGRALTERVSERCSVVYEVSSAGWTWVERFSGWGESEVKAVRVGGSHRSRTFAARRAFATAGHTVSTSELCTIRVSAALHADG